MGSTIQDMGEIDATQQLIQEARERLQDIERRLEEANSELGKVTVNRSQRTRGGKSAGERVERLIASLQGEHKNNLQDVASLESRLHVMLANVASSSVEPLQLRPPSPCNGLAGEEGVTGEKKGTHDVVVQEGTGRSGNESVPGQGSGPEPVDTRVSDLTTSEDQLTLKAMPADKGLSDTLPIPESNPPMEHANPLPSIDNVTEHANPLPSVDNVGGLMDSLPPNCNAGLPCLDMSDVAAAEGAVNSNPGSATAFSPIPHLTQTVCPTDVWSDGLPLPTTPSPSPVVDDETRSMVLGLEIQSKKKKIFITHQSRTKRPPQDRDHSTERDRKRGRHEGLRGPYVTKKGTTQGKRGRRGTLRKYSKEELRLIKEQAAHRFASQIPRSQHVPRHEVKAEVGSTKLNDGGPESLESGGSEEEMGKELGERAEEPIEIETDTETETEGRTGGTKVGEDHPLTDEGSSSIVLISETAVENLYDNNVSDEDLFQTMRVHNETDLEDLGQARVLHSPLVLHPQLPPRPQSKLKGNTKMPPKQPTTRGQSEARGRRGAAKVSVVGEGQKIAAKKNVLAAQRRSPKSEKREGSSSGLGALEKQEESHEPPKEEGVGKPPKEEDTDKEDTDEPEDTDGAGSGGAETKGLPPHERWDVMLPDARRELIMDAQRAVQDFLLHPGSAKHMIPTSLRSSIRNISELCPEASYASRALALHCLTTQCGNTLCLYHHYHDKASTINDTNPPRSHKVTGVPWRRKAHGRGPQATGSSVELESEQALNCGCRVDDALWDFWWWKTQRLYSPTLDIAEPWRNTRLDPRSRGFMVQFLKSLTLLSIDDIYTGSVDSNRSRLAQIRTMRKKLRHARKVVKREMERLAVGGDSLD